MWILIGSLVIIAIIAWIGSYFDKGTSGKDDPGEKKLPAGNGESCGTGCVCGVGSKDFCQIYKKEIDYYNDEELDTLAKRDPETYTEEEIDKIEDVFYTLNEEDVAGWLVSLQQRNIKLPASIKDEAMSIIIERRSATQ